MRESLSALAKFGWSEPVHRLEGETDSSASGQAALLDKSILTAVRDFASNYEAARADPLLSKAGIAAAKEKVATGALKKLDALESKYFGGHRKRLDDLEKKFQLATSGNEQDNFVDELRAREIRAQLAGMTHERQLATVTDALEKRNGEILRAVLRWPGVCPLNARLVEQVRAKWARGLNPALSRELEDSRTRVELLTEHFSTARSLIGRRADLERKPEIVRLGNLVEGRAPAAAR